MKTVNVLTRKMGDFNVFQRTSDGYFDANSLLKHGMIIPITREDGLMIL